MNKLFIASVFTFFVTFSNAIAQNDNYASVKKTLEINSRPLKVVLKKEKSKSAQIFNQKFKDAILSEWKINKKMEFITYEDYKEEDKNSDYAYLMVSKSFERNAFGSNAGQTYDFETIYYFSLDEKKPVLTGVFDLDKKDHKAKYFSEIQKLNLYLTYKVSTKKNEVNIFEFYLKKNRTSLSKNLENLANKAKTTLNTKTLLIDRNLLNKKLDNKIKTNYPFEYKIVSKEEINKAIITNDNTKVILSKASINDADTGDVILSFYIGKNEVMKTKVSPFGIGLSSKIKEKNLINLGSYLN